MGNRQSSVPKEGKGHPEVFYRGVKAAQEGRFTVSEVYFVQALTRHPGRRFWDTLTNAALRRGCGAGPEADAAPPPKEGAGRQAGADAAFGGPLDPSDQAERRSVFCSSVGGAADPAEGAAGGCEYEEDLLPGGGGGDGGGPGEQADARTNGAQSALGAKVVDIHLPLDGDLIHVISYYRLLADIAHTYLKQLATTAHVDKVTGLAGRYCILTISHTQLLLHCLTLWKEAHFSDGGGFIDYDKRRHLSLGSDVAEEPQDDSDSDVRSTSHRRQRWRMMDRTASVLFTLGLLEAKTRYYCLAFLISYAALMMRCYAGLTEQRKINRVHANIVEHLEMASVLVWDLAKEYPNEYLSRLVMANVPRPSSPDRDGISAAGASSHASAQNIHALGGDQHRHLYASGCPWSPTQSALIPLVLARNVRLSVQARVSRHSQAQIRSPAERLSYHYTGWNFDTGLMIVPGCSLHMLRRSLPGFVPGRSTWAHYAIMAEHEEFYIASRTVEADEHRGSVSVRFPEEGDAATRSRFLSSRASEDSAAARKQEERIKQCEEKLIKKRRQINTDLDLSDERTLVALCLEEACALILPSLFLSSVLAKMASEAMWKDIYLLERAIVTGVYGSDSSEWHIIASILRKHLKN
ncbi:hypothetical protein LSCM1_01390 [Leishmania martiniquensis]|uniref:Sodium stibogluconate resistance protein n=1 Tax=Leishmania martiniquensis TaxID=1580590 RepID=A0A836H5I1_9TRYP|nr:hypothetical protein LSCM1_01390 [Leishmania martiniquensis]